MIMRHTVLVKLVPSLMVAMCFAPGAWGQTTASPAATPPAAAPAQSGESKPGQLSERERAEQELKQQEKQRILGVVPNFNTTDVQNAAPLSPGQKFHLMFRSAVDPFQFVASGLDAGLSQAAKRFRGLRSGCAGLLPSGLAPRTPISSTGYCGEMRFCLLCCMRIRDISARARAVSRSACFMPFLPR